GVKRSRTRHAPASGFRELACQPGTDGAEQLLRVADRVLSIPAVEEAREAIVDVFAVASQAAEGASETPVEAARFYEVQPEEGRDALVGPRFVAKRQERGLGGVVRRIVCARDGVIGLLRRRQNSGCAQLRVSPAQVALDALSKAAVQSTF